MPKSLFVLILVKQYRPCHPGWLEETTHHESELEVDVLLAPSNHKSSGGLVMLVNLSPFNFFSILPKP